MRVLIINSMFVNALYRRCADELGALPGIELTVLTTNGWVMNGKPMPLDPVRADAPYAFRVGEAIWKGKENRAFYTEGLTRAIRDAKPEAIYLMEEPFSVFALQVLAARNAMCPNVPVVFFTWNNLSLEQYDYRPSFAYRSFARLNLRSLDYALTANTEGIRVLQDFGFNRPIKTIGYGVDTSHYSAPRPSRVQEIRTTLNVAPSDILVGYVGRLLYMKGIDLLIQAFQQTIRQTSNAKLLLLGSGPEEANLRDQIQQAGLTDAVRFVPVVPHAQVPDYMHALDILVLPSRRVGMWAEQFGRVMVEAMAAGKIVIGSTSGAIPEVIGDAGLTFTENNSVDLALTLRAALDLGEEEKQQLIEKAKARATEFYSWKRFAEQSSEALEWVVNDRRRVTK